MRNHTIDLAHEPDSQPAWLQDWPTEERAPEGGSSSHSLSTHMRQLRKRNRGFSRWFGLAVVIGAIVAFGVVTFFAH